VLAGSKQSLNIIPFSPELKNTSTASMLFVFSLQASRFKTIAARDCHHCNASPGC
jgi:hypothetical protein